VGRITFGALVGLVCVMLMAPQETEFGAKVALLAGLTIMTAVRPLLERVVPAPGEDGDNIRAFAHRVVGYTGRDATLGTVAKRGTSVVIAAVLVVGGLAFGARSAQGILASEPENLMGRLATRIDPATFPSIRVDQAVIDWNHEIDVDGARAIVLTLAENLALENQAMIERDATLLEAINHGDRLEEMQTRLAAVGRSGQTTIETYAISDVRVTLLVPFGRQDGLSLGMIATGTRTTDVLDASGATISSGTVAFETMWAMRRATGSRWLTIAELPVPANA
jgi:hypothetical protein